MTTSQPITNYLPAPPAGTRAASRKLLWTGRILTGFSGAFLLLDGAMKLVQPPEVVRATVQVGYPESVIAGIGITLLACTLLYLIPRTSILGGLLLTAYLGGAVATNVRAEQPEWHSAMAILFGFIVWGGLWLRDAHVRELLPLKWRSVESLGRE